MKKILDACCGGRMFWFDKKHPNVLYGLFRCEYDMKTKEVTAIYPDWQQPFFDFVAYAYGFAFHLTGGEPVFPINFYGKNKRLLKE